MRRILIIVTVLFVVAAIALYTLPAVVAYAWFGQRLLPATLADLSGDVWHGHAGVLRVLGQDIGKLDWRLSALPLLRGAIEAQAHVSGSGGSGHAFLRQSADQVLDVSDAVLSLPAATVEPALGVPSLQLRGTLDINLVHARLRGLWVESIEGSAVWRDAAVAGAAQARLSDLRIDFSTQPDGRIVGSVRDLGGPLAAVGHCEFKLGAYAAEVRLAARDGDRRVLDVLQYVGQPQADGSVLLKIQGHVLSVF